MAVVLSDFGDVVACELKMMARVVAEEKLL
jgi:hypothetical protein